MKKIIVLLLLCALLVPGALAAQVETEENPALSLEEMEIYYDKLMSTLKMENCAIQQDEQGRYVAQSTLGDVFLSQPALTEETHITGIRLSVGQPCLRGLMVGDTLDMIFQVYPSDNPSLYGNYYEATLAFRGDKPQICLGYILREGQRVQEVTYLTYNWQSDGIVKSGVTYTMDQNYIQQITLFTADELLTEEQAETEISESALVQEERNYFAFPTSQIGTDLDPFCREDLAFAGLDFYSLTPDQAIQVLGAPAVDEWTPDSDGTQIRLMQWNGVELVSKYTANRQFQSVYSFSVNDDVLEGPRGLRIGDYMDTVLFRFRHSEGSLTDNGVLLYGNGQNAPYGQVVYGPETNTVTYTVSLDGEVCMMYLTFAQDTLQQMQFFKNR